jgi:hypothetical protein
MYISHDTWYIIFCISTLLVFFCSGMITGAYLVSKRNEKAFRILTETLTEKEKYGIVSKVTMEEHVNRQDKSSK